MNCKLAGDRLQQFQGWCAKVFKDNNLPIFLVTALVISISAPGPGKWVGAMTWTMDPIGNVGVVSFFNVAIVFFISGLRLETRAICDVLQSPKGLITAVLLILVTTPCLGFVTARLPLRVSEFAQGLTVFACTPTTLASGAAMVAGCPRTEQAAELALMVVAVTNILGCFTTPIALRLTLGGAHVSINPLPVLLRLSMSLLFPLMCGKVIHDSCRRVQVFAKTYKVWLSIFANFNVILITWQSLSSARSDIVAQPVEDILLCVAASAGLHLVLWIMNAPVLLFSCIASPHQRRAIWFLASEKTLPVSLAVVAALPINHGMASLPCIFAFLFQLLADSALVSYWTWRARVELPMQNEIALSNRTLSNQIPSNQIPSLGGSFAAAASLSF
jgi:predicted Na+-dependent transporter